MVVVVVVIVVVVVVITECRQCFDIVGLASGRAFSL